MPKYCSDWSEDEALWVWRADDAPLAAELPEDLILELKAARENVQRLERQIFELTQEPQRAESMRRSNLTPKQRREEDFARAGIRHRA